MPAQLDRVLSGNRPRVVHRPGDGPAVAEELSRGARMAARAAACDWTKAASVSRAAAASFSS